MKKKNLSTNTFASISLFFGLLGLILSFLPLSMFAIIPAGIGIFFGIIAYMFSRRNSVKKNFVYIVLSISVSSIIIAYISKEILGNKLAKDEQFEQQVETTTKEDESDLSEAFEEEEVKVDSTVNQPKEEFIEESFEEDIED